MKPAIDWEAVSAALFDACDKPAAVLDASLRFLLTTRELDRVLGAEKKDLLARTWPDVCAPRGEAERVATMLRTIIGGSAATFDGMVYTADGRLLRATLEAREIQAGAEPLLLVWIVRWTLIRASAPPGFDTDHHYEISAAPLDFGTIRSFWTAGAAVAGSSYVGRRCYEVLYGRSVRCGSCPAERAHMEGTTLTVALRGVHDPHSFRVMTAKPTAKDGVEVGVRELDASVVTPLIHARIDELARSANLSSRERAVLELLLLGRSPDEVAKVLGIAPRTAKFHQKNLLAKLGAESRHDLLRLLV